MTGAQQADARHPLGEGAWAAGAVALASVLHLLLDTWLAGQGRYLFFMLTLTGLSWRAGPRATLAAAVLTVPAAQTLGWLAGPGAYPALAAFLAAAFALTVVSAAFARLRTGPVQAGEHAIGRPEGEKADAVDELNLLVDSAVGYAIYMLDPTGRITIWNEGAERLTGWHDSEALGRPADIIYPESAVAEGKPGLDLERARRDARFEETDWRVRRNGSEFLAHVTVTALFDAAGGLRGYGTVVRDVTEQHAAERRLLASADQFRSILATVPDPMIVIDERGKILSFSAAAERLFGTSEAEVVGTNVSGMMPSPDSERHDGYIRRYLETGEKRIIDTGRVVTGLRRDGTTFPMELAVGQAKTDSGRIFTGFIRDLTEKHFAEARIEELRSDLVHTARVSAMGTMASTLAHELNQPITAVVNYVRGVRNLMQQGGPEGPDAEDVGMMIEGLDAATEQGLRAGDIVRRLREFVSRGEVEKTVEELPDLVTEASKLALIDAREKGVEVRFELDPAVTRVLVEKVQTQQVIINLMRNAIEAMADAPERALTVSSAPQDPGMIRVTVRDTGPGVAPAIAENLFRAFHSTKSEGMGLGLSICRTIIEANGGRIWMEPGRAGGSAFHFTLLRADMEMPE